MISDHSTLVMVLQDVNSPVTDEVLLIEDGPVWAEECCGATVLLAHIERLQRGEMTRLMDKQTWQSAAVSV